MEYMFRDCKKLKSIDFSGLEIEKLENAQLMFCGCDSLESISFPAKNSEDFNTSCLENMHSMFKDCAALKSLDLSGFDTSAAMTAGAQIFASWTSLSSTRLLLKIWAICSTLAHRLQYLRSKMVSALQTSQT